MVAMIYIHAVITRRESWGENTFEKDLPIRGSRSYRILQGHRRQQNRLAQHELDYGLENGMSRYFFRKLNPPRPFFARDMTDEERRLMGDGEFGLQIGG